MRGKYFLLGYLLVKVMALVCKADGEPGLLGGFVMIATSNGSSREEESVVAVEEHVGPHLEDRCRGYYDVMGQWDPPFICKTGDYLYCCGTCGFRFCCSIKKSRLDQSTCKNYDTPVWMKTGQTPFKKINKMHDTTKDKTNLIVYIICAVVAIMALVGIFTKLGLEKAHRPQRENMSRAVASVLQGGCPEGGQINNNVGLGPNMGQQHPYPALSQLAHVYEQQQQQQQQPPGKELNKYASLKAVAAKYNGELYNKRRLMVELPSKGGFPLQPMAHLRSNMVNMSSMSPPMTTNPMASNPMHPTMTHMTQMTSLGPLTPEPVATYVTEIPTMSSVSTLPTERHGGGGGGAGGVGGLAGGLKANGQKPKGSHGLGGPHMGPHMGLHTAPHIGPHIGPHAGPHIGPHAGPHAVHISHGTHTHTHTHGHGSKGPGGLGLGGPSAMIHMTGTMPGGSSMGMSRAAAAEAAFVGSGTMGHHPMAYSSNTIGAGQGMGLGMKAWDGTETVGRRKAYGHKRPQCTILEPNPLHNTRGHSHSQHFLPTQPYFVTNSKTEVTV